MSSLVFAGAFCVSLIGAVVQSVCGFGYGPLNMSLLPYLMPYQQAVALAGLCGTTTAAMVAFSGWRAPQRGPRGNSPQESPDQPRKPRLYRPGAGEDDAAACQRLYRHLPPLLSG